MLKLKPNCECCDGDLPAASERAMICTYECTFCADCVRDVLHNVCPNCGGGFQLRPIRPRQELRPGVSLTHQPASTERIKARYTPAEMAEFAAQIKAVDPRFR